MDQHISLRSALDFQRELGRYWRHVRRQGSLPITAQGWVHRNSFKGLLAALGLPAQGANEADYPRLRFTRLLLLELGALVKKDRALVANEACAFFGLALNERVKQTFDTWLLRSVWNELADIRGVIQSHIGKREFGMAMQRARRAVLNAMHEQAKADPGGWHSFDELATTVRARTPDFMFKRAKAVRNTWFYESPYYGANNPFGISIHPEPRSEAEVWERVERPFIAHVLVGSLHWLGLVDLKWRSAAPSTAEQELEAYRLTDAGAWLLALSPSPQFIEEGGRIVVQPNFTILALEPVSDLALADLESFADFQGGERALHYQLTRQSAYRGQSKGWTAARVIQFLEQHQGAPIPANVRRTLEDWESACKRIVVRKHVTLVQFADATDASQALPALAPMNPLPLGECFVQLPHHTAHQAAQQLTQAGWIPILQGERDDGMDQSIVVSELGEVRFTSATPSIHAQQFIARLTERLSGDGGSTLFLTRKRIGEALAQGMSLEAILQTLSRLQGEPLPSVLQERITQWARFYGSAQLRSVTLLQLSSAEVLGHVLADRELSRLIQRRISPTEALVEAEHVPLLRAKLAERGVELAPAPA
ncbi:MAG: helicase-associated domain-containing protein [Thermoflexales bacterium]|nr:helicase-associated domain-containing protein [Thermoflexales bacterium]